MYRALLPGLALIWLSGCTDGEKPIDDSTSDSIPTDDSNSPDDSTPTGDADGDGDPDTTDCSPDDNTVYNGAPEVCDEKDNDCNGNVDDNATDASTFYADADGDAYGDGTAPMASCVAPPGMVTDNTDCDDANASIFPGAPELCNGIDDNCNGELDDDAVDAATWYMDADQDGFGDPLMFALSCGAVDGFVADSTDCNDADVAVYPGAIEVCNGVDDDCDGYTDTNVTDALTWYMDADNDGFGDDTMTTTDCTQPVGYAQYGGDCDDGDAAYNPGASEADCADPNDYNCDGSVGYADADSDGFAACEDCDDNNVAINAGAVELCDGADNNCDGSIDEDSAQDAAIWYADADTDGFGDATMPWASCSQPSGYVADSSDCNDGDNQINAGVDEVCDGVDNNCDGTTDENTAVDAAKWYGDADTDGYGDSLNIMYACAQPYGYVADGSDCDDSEIDIYPGASEYCDGVDNNCDGTTDEDSAADAPTWYADADTDTFGAPNTMMVTCAQPAGYVADWTDCDDTASGINPNATEYCDGIDNNCDTNIDEDAAADAASWYADSDNDNFGDPNVMMVACTQPAGYLLDWTDCNDSNNMVYPSAPEYCNGIDDSCDGTIDEDSAVDATTWYADMDQDTFGNPNAGWRSCAAPSGYVASNTDCDDNNNAVNPSAVESCDGIDNNCDLSVDDASSVDAATWYQDSDNDTYGDASAMMVACTQPAGYVADNTDCGPTDLNIHPNAPEYCNSADDDCDGTTDESDAVDASIWYLDGDNDSYGGGTNVRACNQPSGYVASSSDCDDNNGDISPAALEYCDNIDNNCDSQIDESSAVDAQTWYLDVDGDTYGDASSSVIACTQPSGYALNDNDCDDNSNSVHPGASDTCDGVDSDCDGADEVIYYQDSDGDGFGNSSVSTFDCTGEPVAPLGYRLDGTDCNDASILVHPYAYDLSTDSTDSDCDGSTSGRVTYTNATTGDDTSTTVSVSSSLAFPLCGTNYTNFYMISNGRITLGSSDTDYSESLSELTADTAIMPYWDDLYTNTAGQLRYATFSDAVAFYWIAVIECCSGSATYNISFSAVLFHDGTVLVTYGPNTLLGKDAIIGWSCTPASTPTETNLSAISYSAGYWGYGAGTERAVVEQFTGTSDPFDMNGIAVRYCANPTNSGLDHCAE